MSENDCEISTRRVRSAAFKGICIMTATRKYRGRYPTRIKMVASGHFGRGVTVTLYNGDRYVIVPVTAQGRADMPRSNRQFGDYAAPHYTISPVIVVENTN